MAKHTGRKRVAQQEMDLDGDGEEFISLNLSSGAKRTIFAVFFVAVAIVFVLGFFDAAGALGAFLTGIVSKAFGFLGKFLAPVVALYVAYILLRNKKTSFYVTKIIGILVAFVFVLVLLHLPFDPESFHKMAAAGRGGGYVGALVAQLLVMMAGKIVAGVIAFTAIVIGGIIAFDMSLVGTPERLGQKRAPSLLQKLSFFGGTKNSDAEEAFEEGDGEKTEDGEVADDVQDDTLDLEGFDDDDVDDDSEDISDEDDEGAEANEGDVIEEGKNVTPAAQRARALVRTQPAKKKRPMAASQLMSTEEWQLPPLRLLGAGGGKAKGGDVQQRAQVIQDTFANFGIAMELEDIITGPTVTQYSFRPPSGVKLTKITALSADLALALAAHPIRIEAPIPGKSLVGIEVPNKETAKVRLRDIINTETFENADKKLLLALGEDVSGDYVIEDLGKMPHLLVAGATGAGKSVAINSILLSLLYKNAPDELKMILVDPKRVELSLYNGIPHLLSDVITDHTKVLNALKWAVSEMERRYKLLQAVGTRDLDSYTAKRKAGETYVDTDLETGEREEKALENLPVIVIVIDEMADLMGAHGKEVEGSIVRLAQMSRAVGIHLILSTQRPSVEVITGTIKANLPTRIALRVATGIDSRTIIDMPGAEKLVGYGDMLFTGPASASPHRLQGVFVSEDEVKKVIDFIKRQAKAIGAYDIDNDFVGDDHESGTGTEAGITAVDFTNVAGTASGIGADNTDQDPMLDEAKKVVLEAGKASTSYIQRRLRVGYSRAARLIDALEDQGIIGPADGSKPRAVLVGADAAETDAPTPMEEQVQRDQWEK